MQLMTKGEGKLYSLNELIDIISFKEIKFTKQTKYHFLVGGVL